MHKTQGLRQLKLIKKLVVSFSLIGYVTDTIVPKENTQSLLKHDKKCVKCLLFKPDLKTCKIHLSHELNIRPLVFIAFDKQEKIEIQRRMEKNVSFRFND